jgi:hypothetical protein
VAKDHLCKWKLRQEEEAKKLPQRIFSEWRVSRKEYKCTAKRDLRRKERPEMGVSLPYNWYQSA